MSQLPVKVRTLISLGVPNLWRVATYRVGLRMGLSPVRRLKADLPQGPFFGVSRRTGVSPPPSSAWQDEARYFGWFLVSLKKSFPDWQINPLSGGRFADPNCPWWQLPDFDPAVGDIKTVWEASRFDWVLAMAERVCSGQAGELDRLNAWIKDWCQVNPAYLGPNWKCGQEASIRVMHLAMAALLLGQLRNTEAALIELVRAHLARIAPTLRYALAQDNNHGTSEAAALFIGGSWLAANGDDAGHAEGEGWTRTGRNWIEERVNRLVAEDGSFSQYSVVYHRVLLDTLSMVEVWRRALGLQPFSARFAERARSAAVWLKAFTQTPNGDAPNMGANDGARLVPLSDTDFRDFRPSVQLGCALFADARAFAAPGSWDLPLQWLGVPLPERVLPDETNRLCDQGGYAILRKASASVYLRYPRFRFRPGHADALHLDLWVDSRNILRDAGSYGYYTEPRWTSYFPGTAAHNTVEFDERDQMPRLDRFLFGDWLRTNERSDIEVEGGETRISVGYRDRQGATHDRQIILGTYRMVVEDAVAGFREKAILRWRLEPSIWHLDNTSVSNGRFRLAVTTNVPLHRVELVEGWESRYYLNREPLPVLELEIRAPGVFRTELCWAP
jgi:hypothetical protein